MKYFLLLCIAMMQFQVQYKLKAKAVPKCHGLFIGDGGSGGTETAMGVYVPKSANEDDFDADNVKNIKPKSDRPIDGDRKWSELPEFPMADQDTQYSTAWWIANNLKTSKMDLNENSGKTWAETYIKGTRSWFNEKLADIQRATDEVLGGNKCKWEAMPEFTPTNNATYKQISLFIGSTAGFRNTVNDIQLSKGKKGMDDQTKTKNAMEGVLSKYFSGAKTVFSYLAGRAEGTFGYLASRAKLNSADTSKYKNLFVEVGGASIQIVWSSSKITKQIFQEQWLGQAMGNMKQAIKDMTTRLGLITDSITKALGGVDWSKYKTDKTTPKFRKGLVNIAGGYIYSKSFLGNAGDRAPASMIMKMLYNKAKNTAAADLLKLELACLNKQSGFDGYQIMYEGNATKNTPGVWKVNTDANPKNKVRKDQPGVEDNQNTKCNKPHSQYFDFIPTFNKFKRIEIWAKPDFVQCKKDVEQYMLGTGDDGNDEQIDHHEIKKIIKRIPKAQALNITADFYDKSNREEGPFNPTVVSYSSQLENLKEKLKEFPVGDGRCEKIVLNAKWFRGIPHTILNHSNGVAGPNKPGHVETPFKLSAFRAALDQICKLEVGSGFHGWALCLNANNIVYLLERLRDNGAICGQTDPDILVSEVDWNQAPYLINKSSLEAMGLDLFNVTGMADTKHMEMMPINYDSKGSA